MIDGTGTSLFQLTEGEKEPTMTQEAFRIDVHHHIVPPEYVAALTSLGIKGGGGVDFPPWNPQSSLNMMDRQGIATAILSLPTLDDYLGDHALARDLARRYNDYCANLVYRYPQRFGAFATLPLPDVNAALLELEYALDTLHLDGVILMSSYEGRYLGDPAFEPVFTELNRRKAVVFVHPTVPPNDRVSPLPLPVGTLEFVFDTTRAVVNLAARGTLGRCPDLRIILAHAGGTVPYLAERIAGAISMVDREGRPLTIQGIEEVQQILGEMQSITASLQRLYYDTALSASPYIFRALQELVTPAHVLFGSDYPWANEMIAAFTLRGIENDDGFDDQMRRTIERENALALFPRLNEQG
jgi:predicted TIM-barrel fold metal-dependent hydrolase